MGPGAIHLDFMVSIQAVDNVPSESGVLTFGDAAFSAAALSQPRGMCAARAVRNLFARSLADEVACDWQIPNVFGWGLL